MWKVVVDYQRYEVLNPQEDAKAYRRAGGARSSCCGLSPGDEEEEGKGSVVLAPRCGLILSISDF